MTRYPSVCIPKSAICEQFSETLKAMNPCNPIRLSLFWRLLLITIGLLIALLWALTAIQIKAQHDISNKALAQKTQLMREQRLNQGQILGEILAQEIENDLAVLRFSAVSIRLQQTASRYPIDYAMLMAQDGIVHAHTRDRSLELAILSAPEDRYAMIQTQLSSQEYTQGSVQYLEVIVPIRISTKPWGVLRLGFALTQLQAAIAQSQEDSNNTLKITLMRSLFSAILLGLMGTVLMGIMARRISQPLATLTQWADHIAAGEMDYEVPHLTHRHDEVGVLANAFAKMTHNLQQSRAQLEDTNQSLEQKVADRTLDLQQAVDKITAAHEALQQSQERLVQVETMAALGQLVAGVAHEINTPLGVAVTVASHLATITEETTEAVTSTGLTRSQFTDYLADASESSRLLLNNLQAADRMVKSFKTVATDQTSQECRRFNVMAYLNEVVSSLKPSFKKTSHQITIEGDTTLEIESYPGALAQVVTNLLMNSLHHAYLPNTSGTLSIQVSRQVSRQETGVLLCYWDDGQGIAPEHLPKIFDPFFTTKRGQGGTGLGLHIVFNTVNLTLKGTIRCESIVGKGTMFLIQLPFSIANQTNQTNQTNQDMEPHNAGV